MRTTRSIAAVSTVALLALVGCEQNQDAAEEPSTTSTTMSAEATPSMTETANGMTESATPTQTPTMGSVSPGTETSTPTSSGTPRATGGADITTPFMNNDEAKNVAQFVDRVEMDDAGVVIVYTNLERTSAMEGEQEMAKNAMSVCEAAVSIVRDEQDRPEPVNVMDANREILSTNIVDGEPGEECAYVSQ